MKHEDDEKVKEVRVGKNVPNDPLVSVIIPAYNCSPFIAESVGAALSQTLQDHEVIVINDGSEDTVELEGELEPYLDEITYVVRENGGPGAARNSGIIRARGEFIGFVDGDDVWRSEFLESQLAAMKAKNCDLIYCDAQYFGKNIEKERTFAQRSPSHGPVTPEALIRGKCNVILSGTLVKKQVVVDNGLFTESALPVAIEDFELWFRLSKNGVKLDYQNKILLDYRVHGSNISGNVLKIAERGLIGMRYLSEHFELTEGEMLAIDDRLQEFETQLAMEKAKVLLAHREFSESLRHIKSGAAKSGNKKLRAIAIVMGISPGILMNVFKRFRPEEFQQALREDPSEIS